MGEWPCNHFQHVLGLREKRDLLVTEFSLVKWFKCLGCHMVMEKGIQMDTNLSNIVIVYSTVAVVMMRIGSQTGVTIHQNQEKLK